MDLEERLRQLLIIMAVMAAVTNAAPETSTTGKTFYFGLPRTVTQIPSPKVIIGTPTESANFSVETEAGIVFNGTATSTSPATVNLNNNLQIGSSNYTDRLKGIRVLATGESPIFVLVTMEYSNASRIGYADYLIHPNMEVAGQSSYEYFGLSTNYSGQSFPGRTSQMILVGNDDATTISITPSQRVNLPEDAQNSSSPLVTVQAGSTHNVTINRLQTLLIFHSEFDLTGTKVVSNKPLTVLSGHSCAQFPSDQGFCEPVFVHVPPTFTWGKEFFLAAFAGRSSTRFYRLVTAEESTMIVYRCGTSQLVEIILPSAGSGTTISLHAFSHCSLSSTKPIFVVQLGAGHQTDSVGDPVMVIVSPTIGYVSSTRFITLSSSDFSTSYILVTVQAEHFDQTQILLDGERLSCVWMLFYNNTSDDHDVIGYGCSASVTEGVHNVAHSGDNGVLSVVAYGWNNNPAWGYAYLTAIHLYDAATDQTSQSTSATQLSSTEMPTPSADNIPNQTVLVVGVVILSLILITIGVVAVIIILVLFRRRKRHTNNIIILTRAVDNKSKQVPQTSMSETVEMIPQRSVNSDPMRPQMSNLTTLVAHKIPIKWYEMGLLLNIETGKLNAFEVETRDQVRLCILVFEQWEREQKVPFTWETIINTVDAVGEKKTAADIKEWVDKSVHSAVDDYSS